MPKSQRKSQVFVPGLGQHYTSPRKAAPRKPQLVQQLGHSVKKRRLAEELAKLLSNDEPTTSSSHDPNTPTVEAEVDKLTTRMSTEMDIDSSHAQPLPTLYIPLPPPPRLQDKAKKPVVKLYDAWEKILPSLIDPLLEYEYTSAGKLAVYPLQIPRLCRKTASSCEFKTFKILCLFQDHFQTMEVQGCHCETIPQRLVVHGLFPTSPNQPRMAISIDLLNFYHTLFEESCDAIHAMSHALKKFYARRGYILASQHMGDEVKEPFRRSLGYALQWHDSLRVLIDRQVQAAISAADTEARLHLNSVAAVTTSTSYPMSDPTRCARELRNRCPACFGGNTFGVPFSDGGDFHVAVDGNFHHRHRRSAGDGCEFHAPEYFLSKEYVDTVGARIHKARKSPKKVTKAIVPNEAVDQCQQSHDAANDNKAKSNAEQFDDHGCSALVCRHGAPLFTANIDTPGEQQKYAVALIQYLFQKIPKNATVLVLYDVGCVLDRSLQLYDILPPEITQRLSFTTSAMHALIGITRTSGRSRRIWILDRQLSSIGSSHRDDLGDWLTRRHAFARRESLNNRAILQENGFTDTELRDEWSLQRQAQLSVQAHAPLRLKQELDSILNLQAELDSLDKSIEATKRTLSQGKTPLEASRLLPELTSTGDKLRAQADQIYDSLNVQNRFPELNKCSFEFVRILLILHDLKINIRKRVVGSFFEWDKLDQAVGGRQQTIGTKIHQRTRNAITKRKPALLAAINKYNTLCGTLKKLHDPSWLVPLPKPLPTQLSALRDAQVLMEDIWITPYEVRIPRWLENVDIRNGIRAVQRVDRCTEEAKRLECEAQHLCLWLAAEAAAVRRAITDVTVGARLSMRIKQYQASIERLEARWTCSLIPRQHLQVILRTSEATNAHPLSESVAPGSLSTPAHESIDFLLELDEYEDQEKYPDTPFLDPEEAMTYDLISDEDDAGDREHDEATRYHEAFVKRTEPSTQRNEADAKDARWSKQSHKPAVEAATEPSRQHNEASSEGWLKPHPEAPVEASESLQVDLEDGSRIEWNLPEKMRVESGTLSLLQHTHYMQDERTIASADVSRTIGRRVMYGESIKLLASPDAWLDDVCINGCAELLQRLFTSMFSETAQSCAIFDTHDLVRVHSNVTDNCLWEYVMDTEYWNKNTWVIPIHRPSPEYHWVLCIARPHSHSLLLFDSFGQQRSWGRDVQDVMRLITRLVLVANRRGRSCRVIPDGWIARPLCVKGVQSNGYDCGVWILSTIAAVLQGYEVSGMTEDEISQFRHELLRAVLSQPVYKRTPRVR
ncbi:peptidase C48 family protein [Pleurotus pulmonarius]